jgi:hypothetical protein
MCVDHAREGNTRGRTHGRSLEKDIEIEDHDVSDELV